MSTRRARMVLVGAAVAAPALLVTPAASAGTWQPRPSTSTTTVSITGPSLVTRGSVVTLTGTSTAPGSSVQVYFHKQNTTGYTLRRTLTADSQGNFSTGYIADVDYRYYAVSNGMQSPSGLTQARGTTIAGPLTVPYGATVHLSGLASPGSTVVVYFHRRGTTGYTPRRTLTAAADGRYATSYVAGDDHRYYALAAGRRSNVGLTVAAVQVRAGDDGRTITLPVGRRAAITLSANAGAGYSWKLRRRPDSHVATADEVYTVRTTTYVNGQPTTGSSATQVFTFTGVGRGSTAVRLDYLPPGSNPPPADSFTVTFAVS